MGDGRSAAGTYRSQQANSDDDAKDTKAADASAAAAGDPNLPIVGNPETGPVANTVFYEAMFQRLTQRGFYKLKLNSTDTNREHVRWIGCNLEVAEGDLKLVDSTQLMAWVGDRVEFVPLDIVGSQSVDVARDEFWFQILLALLAILGLEQFLAVWFGSRRS